MATRNPGGRADPSALTALRERLADLKPRLVKWLLSSVAVLGVAAELIDPVGDALQGQQFLGGSFAAVVALILFDAISDTGEREGSGVDVLSTLSELNGPVNEAFQEPHVDIYFSGFTMETLYGLIRDPLMGVADGTIRPKRVTLRIIVAHLDLPMNLPGALSPHPDESGRLVFGDSEDNRERMREDYTLKYWRELRALLDRVRRHDPRIVIDCEVRESPHGPQAKLYILNEARIFHGWYGIEESTFERDGRVHDFLDAAGLSIKHGDARYFGWTVRSGTKTTRQVARSHLEWFQNLWDVLDRVKPATPVIRNPVWEPPQTPPASGSPH